jgi:hypothetical protein
MKKAARSVEEDQLEHDFELLEIAGSYIEMAAAGLSGKKLNDTIQDWAKGHLENEPDHMQLPAIMGMALDTCLFMPSMSGSTPMDRFIAGVRTDDPMSRQALKALSRSEIRWVGIRERLDSDLMELEDRISGERLVLINSDYTDASQGLQSLMRLCRLDSGRYIHINSSFALTAGLTDIIKSYIRPGKGISNPYRCAVAVYKHAVREGVFVTPRVFIDDIDDADPEDVRVSMAMAMLHEQWRIARQDPKLLEELKSELRSEADGGLLLSALMFYSVALEDKLAEEEENFREICALVAETLVLQQRYGLVHAGEQLQFVKQTVSDGIRDGNFDKRCAAFLDNLLSSNGYGTSIGGVGDPELDKVIQRIRALQAKTTDQGCTEEEAVAAAEKAAELLDRYGLQLTESSVREIGCEAVRYDTGRKRRNDTDLLCMVVSRFFDCRGWLTKTPEGEIQHVVFGFRADAEAAVLLIGRVYDIIDNATKQFKQGEVYNGLSGARKRTAASSFQTGMVHGVAEKLNKLKDARIAHRSGNTGTALVVVKEEMIQEEIDKLGLSMRKLPEGEAMIHADSFHAGKQSGLTFSPEDHLE